MQFTSFEFAVFFPTVLLIFYLLPQKLRTIWLLAASYCFYMTWDVRYIALIVVTTAITYVCGRAAGALPDKRKGLRRLTLWAGLLLNLGILFYFKYITGAVPVGMSFYTFQALGYVIDVYRGDTPAERNVVRYALFVAFFPLLLSGPIERSRHLLPQLEAIAKRPLWNWEHVVRGLLMMLWGYFLKLVLADRAATVVDTVFDNYYMLDGVALLLGMLLFSVQLYCDFASYSAIAIGAAGVLGIEVSPNFAAPFLSKSVSEFWRRWHISLSSWLRDYVYIPLGGNHCSKPRKYFNIMITFLVSGAWHGASLHYVFWGALQGIFIVIGDILRPIKDKFNRRYAVRTESAGYRAGRTVMTYVLFLSSFTFFRAESISDGVYYLERLVRRFDAWSLLSGYIYTLGLDGREMFILVLGMVILFVVDWGYQKRQVFFDTLVREQCLVVQYLIVITLFVLVLVCGVYGEGYDASEFIYFQF